MKTRNGLLLIALAGSMLTIAGCSQEELRSSDNEESGTEEVVTVGAALPQPSDTKVAYTRDGANKLMKTTWEEGDAIYQGSNKFTQSGTIHNDGHTSAFTGSMNISANSNYYFTYPTKRSNNGFTTLPSPQSGLRADIKKYDFMVAAVKSTDDKTLPDFTFTRTAAFLELAGVKFGTGVNASITSISMNGAAFGTYEYLSTAPDTYGEITQVQRKETIQVTPDKAFTVENGVLKDTVYIAFYPMQNAAAGNECTIAFIANDGKTYELKWNAATKYTAGNVYTLAGTADQPIVTNIVFADNLTKKYCVYDWYGDWDLNKDGELSDFEASMVTTVEYKFQDATNITSFDEFQYFTGVAEIANNAFLSCSKLKSITLPENIVKIGSDAFNGCSSLTSIVIPSKVTTINAGAFKNCASLSSITIPETVKYMGEGQTFAGCSSLKTLNWPDSTTVINAQTFQNAGLENFTIPESVTSVGIWAFLDCHNLKSVNFPASVTEVGAKAFNNCYNISNFNVASGCAFSASSDGQMLIKDGKTAVCCFGNKSNVVFPESITEINANFADGCEKIKTVIIPAVTTLGNYAFANCAALTTATYADDAPTGNYTFQNDSSLAEVTLPKNATTIGNYLFSGCSSLKKLTLPAGIKTVNSGAFSGCSSLEEIALPEGMTEIVSNLFSGCSSLKKIDIPTTVTKIGSGAFQGCSGLTSITIPPAVTKYESNLFKDCTGFTSFTIPSTVTSIGSSIFSGCTNLTLVSIPSSITAIPNYAFQNCSNLTIITLPSTIKTLGYGAFSGTGIYNIELPANLTTLPNNLFQNCKNLYSFTVPSTVTTIGMYAFAGCTNLKSIEMPSVKTINQNAFQGCGLKSVKLPDNCTSLGNSVFADCASLKTLDLNKVASLGVWAFQNCSALESITIPATVTKINMLVFSGCDAVKYVIMEGSKPASINYNSFPANGCPLYVPDAAYDAYKAATYWGNSYYYLSRLFPISAKS